MATYGALYNWYTVNTNKICPPGWHVPTNDEWTNLTTFLGGADIAGGKLKETGTAHWQSPNSGATNESGFTALGSGSRYGNGGFNNLKLEGSWWSSTLLGGLTGAQARYLNADNSLISGGNGSDYTVVRAGGSIRCIKD